MTVILAPRTNEDAPTMNSCLYQIRVDGGYKCVQTEQGYHEYKESTRATSEGLEVFFIGVAIFILILAIINVIDILVESL